MEVLLSSSSREERVERNRDTMVRSSLGVSLKRGIFRRRRYRTREVVAIFVFVTKQTAVLLVKTFFFTHRRWLFKNTTSWILWWFWISFRYHEYVIGYCTRAARNIICHPCAVDLMINETIYYTTRVGDDIFTSSSKSFSVSQRNPQSRWTIKILWIFARRPLNPTCVFKTREKEEKKTEQSLS